LQKRLDEEIQQLLVDIKRIGDEPGSPRVKFGQLFEDDDVQQYYEALVGTLKSAKRRGYIQFKGQILLKGMHDSVVISISKEGEEKQARDSAKSSPNTVTPTKEGETESESGLESDEVPPATEDKAEDDDSPAEEDKPPVEEE